MDSHFYICTPNKTGTVLEDIKNEICDGAGVVKNGPSKKYLVVSKRFLPLHPGTKKRKRFQGWEKRNLPRKIFESMGNNRKSLR